MQTSLWFPVRGESQKRARNVCARCPVSDECWEYACRSDTSYGIWGGRIIKRGKERNTIISDVPESSYQWSMLYLTEELYWDAWEDDTTDETQDTVREFGEAI